MPLKRSSDLVATSLLIGGMIFFAMFAATPLDTAYAIDSGTSAQASGTYASSGNSALSTSPSSSSSSSSSSLSSTLTVASVNTNGQEINGYMIALFWGEGPGANGFTPVSFSIFNGVDYVVQADDYGTCHFSHWADTGSTSASRQITISSNTQITAVYDCNYSSASSITVNSVALNGSNIFGYYTVLRSGGSVVGTGFTTKTFPTNPGQTYSVETHNYRSCNFTHWTDGVTSNPRAITATNGSQSFTAVYDCTISLAVVSGDYYTSTEIFGYHIVLYHGGNIINTGFTQVTFALKPGETYTLRADSYGSCQFYYWVGIPGQGENTVYTNPVTFIAPMTNAGVFAGYKCS